MQQRNFLRGFDLRKASADLPDQIQIPQIAGLRKDRRQIFQRSAVKALPSFP